MTSLTHYHLSFFNLLRLLLLTFPSTLFLFQLIGHESITWIAVWNCLPSYVTLLKWHFFENNIGAYSRYTVVESPGRGLLIFLAIWFHQGSLILAFYCIFSDIKSYFHSSLMPTLYGCMPCDLLTLLSPFNIWLWVKFSYLGL
jgi:hypothetical protein